jgi:excisionase family DNA binding protein
LLKSQPSGVHELNGPSGNQSRQTVDLFLDAIADAIADRLDHRQGARRRLLDVEQTAEYLGMSESAVYNLVSDHKLRPVRFDRRIRFDVRDLDGLIDQAKSVRTPELSPGA